MEKLEKEAKQDENVIAMFLYGSYLSEKVFRDIDIALVLNDGLSNKEMSNIRVKYLSEVPDIFDIEIFQLLPLHMRTEVLKGRILFCKDMDRLFDIAVRAIREGELFKAKLKLMVAP
ncbi:MAG: nucleotidyltransferase domain-containing protein [Candidatus Hodarchaeota archaeon]